MNKVKLLLLFLLGFTFVIMFSPLSYGQLYWESEVVTGGIPEGLPKNLPKEVRDQMLAQFKSKTEIAKNYLTSYASRVETGDGIMIIDFETMTMYQINPTEKTYMKVSNTEMEQMSEGMSEEMGWTPTKETKKISGYQCRKYKVTIMGVENEHWLSKDVKEYGEFKAITEKVINKHPSLGKKQIFGILSLYKEGFPVQTVSNVMGMKTTTTLKKIEKKSLSKDLFKVPKNYEQRKLSMPLQ